MGGGGSGLGGGGLFDDIGAFGDVLRSEWEVEQYVAELEQEARRQQVRDATVAQIVDQLDRWDVACRQFDPRSNNLWTTVRRTLAADGHSCLCRRNALLAITRCCSCRPVVRSGRGTA